MKDFTYYKNLKEIEEKILKSSELKDDLKDFIEDWDRYYNIRINTFELRSLERHNDFKEKIFNGIDEYIYKIFQYDKNFNVENFKSKVKEEINENDKFGSYYYRWHQYSGLMWDKRKKTVPIAEVNIEVQFASKLVKKLIEITKINNTKMELHFGYSAHHDSVRDCVVIENGEITECHIKISEYETVEVSINAEEIISNLMPIIQKDNKNEPVLLKTGCYDAYDYTMMKYFSSRGFVPILIGYLSTKFTEKPMIFKGKRFSHNLYIYNGVIYHELEWLRKHFRYKKA